jgi:hypothetical protein
MQLDDWKAAWATHGAMLERSLAIDERLLREVLLRKVRFALLPYVLGRAFEVALGVAFVIAVAVVLARHPDDLRYLVVGSALLAFAVAMTGACAFLLVAALRLDHGGRVTESQRRLQRVRVVEYRTFEAALLGGTLFWLPALLVPFEALTGIDALARVDPGYLVAHLLVGCAVVVVGVCLSKRYVDHRDLSPRARRWVDAMSGRALRTASGHLDELARFERDESGG